MSIDLETKKTVKSITEKYKYGFSDHTTGYEAAICSLILGAKYIEKHITFSKKMYCFKINAKATKIVLGNFLKNFL